MKCPKCGLINSNKASRHDCGYICDCGHIFEEKDTITSQKVLENNQVIKSNKAKDVLFFSMLVTIGVLFIAAIVGGIFLLGWVGSKGGPIDNIKNQSLRNVLVIGFIIAVFLLSGYFASFRRRR